MKNAPDAALHIKSELNLERLTSDSANARIATATNAACAIWATPFRVETAMMTANAELSGSPSGLSKEEQSDD